ncbi:diacylglycerol kinase family protein [Candidatus Saganbacteria bacterium]|nr:diacylglycerol kinase family protein [Candidatus Saganbacteria bacterium]
MPKKFIKSFKYAQVGVKHALQTQRNIWIHLSIGGIVLVAAVCLKLNRLELAILVLTIFGVVVAEIFNTALEVLVDLVSPDQHEQAGLVKNLSAAAVLLAAAGAIVVGGVIFWPRII